MSRNKQLTTGTGRSGAAKYFTEHLSVSDYYANGVGLLQGRGFEHVGMQFREVDLAVFSALEQNLNPETGEKLTPRTKKTRKEWWFKSRDREARSVGGGRPAQRNGSADDCTENGFGSVGREPWNGNGPCHLSRIYFGQGPGHGAGRELGHDAGAAR